MHALNRRGQSHRAAVEAHFDLRDGRDDRPGALRSGAGQTLPSLGRPCGANGPRPPRQANAVRLDRSGREPVEQG